MAWRSVAYVQRSRQAGRQRLCTSSQDACRRRRRRRCRQKRKEKLSWSSLFNSGRKERERSKFRFSQTLSMPQRRGGGLKRLYDT